MKVSTEETATITIVVTKHEAEQIMHDFDQRREPSIPGKNLYTALLRASGRMGP